MGNQQDDDANRLLEGAYALKTPSDNLDYYRDFASHYDASFADAMGYTYPAMVAAVLAQTKCPKGTILDIGCGTGLVAHELRALGTSGAIDGVDLSPEMLDRAKEKHLYQHIFQADLTASLSHLPDGYAALISAGTFTHGHLGPEPLAALIAHCQSGAKAVIGVNAVHYIERAFGPFLDDLVAKGSIDAPALHEVKIFSGADDVHAKDTAFIIEFAVK